MKSIQKLIACLIPIEIASTSLSFYTSHLYFNLGRRQAIANFLHILPSDASSYLEYVGIFCGLATCVVIGVWLFIQAKRHEANEWLWACFGLLAGYWAIALWFLVRLPAFVSKERPSHPSVPTR